MNLAATGQQSLSENTLQWPVHRTARAFLIEKNCPNIIGMINEVVLPFPDLQTHDVAVFARDSREIFQRVTIQGRISSQRSLRSARFFDRISEAIGRSDVPAW